MIARNTHWAWHCAYMVFFVLSSLPLYLSIVYDGFEFVKIISALWVALGMYVIFGSMNEIKEGKMDD